MYSTRNYGQISMKLKFSRKIFEKHSNIKTSDNRPLGADLFHADRWTGMTKARNSGFSQFRETF